MEEHIYSVKVDNQEIYKNEEKEEGNNESGKD